MTHVRSAALAAALMLVTACSSGSGRDGGWPFPSPDRDPNRDGEIYGDRGRDGDRDGDRDGRRGRSGEVHDRNRRAREAGVPPGQMPPRGQCRLWYEGRPPGRQPRAQSCSSLVGRVPRGAFVLYGGREWDTRYDWLDYERRNRGSVPDIILDIMRSLR